jgi:hypothetical protein
MDNANELAKALQNLGGEILGLKLKYSNDSEFGKKARRATDRHLNKVFKKHYLDKGKGLVNTP